MNEESLRPIQVMFLNTEWTRFFFIKSTANIVTDVSRSKTEKFTLFGSGDSYIFIDPESYRGLAILDAKGTLKQDSAGEVTSISISGKVSGGTDSGITFSGTFRTTLTP